MKDSKQTIFGQKVSGVRIVPLTLKITLIFTLLLLISNFASNFINLMLNRGELIELMNQLLVKDLKELHQFCNGQHDIYIFQDNYEKAVTNITQMGMKQLKRDKSAAFGLRPDGSIFFYASPTTSMERFSDTAAFDEILQAKETGKEGSILYNFEGKEYFGVYKYNEPWDAVVLRSEELGEFYAESWKIFRNIALIIVFITGLCVAIGVLLIRFILRFVGRITQSIMQMQENQRIEYIDMQGAPNDDVTYLGMSFNALAGTIDNLMTIFRKFVAKDVAQRAYQERQVRLEGMPKELSILFSDIKSFTYMTETLGTGIINLLNMHYERAITQVRKHDGIVGSIIGDALLAVFGTLPEAEENKSLSAVRTAYEIQDVASALREEMTKRREEILRIKGALTEEEEKIYKAVLIEVGVGIDGGEVFYGNIGSSKRMTNTVIGDNVNSSSRLEGLTRIYKVPVICSDYIKDEIEDVTDDFIFFELDQVQVKGKTIGKKVYWPIKREYVDEDFKKNIEIYEKALALYYKGSWTEARKLFTNCNLPQAELFVDRTSSKDCPEGWNGIWTMMTK
jgi:adenylate cyclase